MFSCKYCKIFKNNYFYKTPPVAASERSNENFSSEVWQSCKGYLTGYCLSFGKLFFQSSKQIHRSLKNYLIERCKKSYFILSLTFTNLKKEIMESLMESTVNKMDFLRLQTFMLTNNKIHNVTTCS